MNQKPATPKDAAAVVLLNQTGTQVLWARRNPRLAFLGGWHAFPGGKLEASDALVEVGNGDDSEIGKFIACAARETFEETGILLARGGDKLTKGQRASLHDDLVSGRMTFAEMLAHWNLSIDRRDFRYTGFWTTPQFSPARFKTRFFLAVCPLRQTPRAAISELEAVEFIEPRQALERWRKSEVLISPPVLLALKTLAEDENAEGFSKTEDRKSKTVSEKLLADSEAAGGDIRRIEFNPRTVCFPLRTATLPPATHTNCFIVGRRRFVVIDHASGEAAEQAELHRFVDSLIEKNFECRAIVTTHHHPDHTGGETALQTHLREKYDLRIPLAAHPATAEKLSGAVEFQETIKDEARFDLTDDAGENFQLRAIHTPGHASGLLAFYDEATGFLLSGDNVVNSSSVVIAPPDGNLKDYLASLERLKNLPNLKFLCGSHGSAVFDAPGKIESYIRHRLERERQIVAAMGRGANTVAEIVRAVYPDLKPELVRLAEKSVEAHLEKIREENGTADARG